MCLWYKGDDSAPWRISLLKSVPRRKKYGNRWLRWSKNSLSWPCIYSSHSISTFRNEYTGIEAYATFRERAICCFVIFQKHYRIWALVSFHEPAPAMTSGIKCNMAENVEEYVVRYFIFVEGWGCMSKKIRKAELVLSFLELYTAFWSISSYNDLNWPKNICPFWSIVTS